jgi:hypothetical protein
LQNTGLTLFIPGPLWEKVVKRLINNPARTFRRVDSRFYCQRAFCFCTLAEKHTKIPNRQLGDKRIVMEPVKMKPKGVPNQWQRILIFMLLSFLVFSVFYPHQERDTLSISYTKFKHEVSQGNIEAVTVKGSQIKGNFKKPLTEELKAPKKGANVQTFKNFTTTKPSFEDPDLLKLLVPCLKSSASNIGKIESLFYA